MGDQTRSISQAVTRASKVWVGVPASLQADDVELLPPNNCWSARKSADAAI